MVKNKGLTCPTSKPPWPRRSVPCLLVRPLLVPSLVKLAAVASPSSLLRFFSVTYCFSLFLALSASGLPSLVCSLFASFPRSLLPLCALLCYVVDSNKTG